MPQVPVWRPLCKLDLRNELGPKPHAVLHLFLSQSPLGALFLGQIGKWTCIGLQPFEFPRYLTPNQRHKPVPYFGGIKEPHALVIANDQRVKGIPWSVTADHQLLPPVDLVLDPCAGSLTRLIE